MSDQINIGTLMADLDLNTSKLDRATANAEAGLFQVRNAIRELQEKLAAGQISLQEYSKEILYLSEVERTLETSVLAASAGLTQATNCMTAATRAAAGMSSATRGAGNAQDDARRKAYAISNALMQLGYAADDVQYGFKGVVNQVAPFSFSIATLAGASTAAAGGIAALSQVLVVSAYQAYENWDKLMDLMGTGKVRTESEEMAELAKKTGKTADETERLNKHKKEQHQIQDLMDRQSKGDKTYKAGVESATGEAGADKVVGALAQTMQADGLGAKMTPADQKKLDALRKPLWLLGPGDPRRAKAQAAFDKAQDKINDRLNAETVNRAQKVIAKAELDETPNKDNLRSLINKVERNPGAFPKGYADQLRDQLPENVKQRKDFASEEADINRMSEDANKDADQKERIKKEEEQKQKESDDFDRQAITDREQWSRKNERRARDENGGIGERAETLVAGSMAGMIAPDEVRAQIKAAIKANDKQFAVEMEAAGKTKGDKTDDARAEKNANTRADDATNAILSDAETNVYKKLEHESNKGDEKMSKSQQFDATELAAKVQAGVGDQESKKQTTILDKILKSLEAQAQNGNPIKVTFK